MRAEATTRGGTVAPLERVVLGSRRSRLARAQARRVGEAIAEAWPAIEVAYATMTTRGDRLLDRPLPEVGGKGLFTTELEGALRRGAVDLAVHSLKDLPTTPSRDLAVLAIPPRDDPRDVLIAPTGGRLESLPPGASVGTSSLRRAALLLRARPDCRVTSIRGNVETRLEKLAGGACDALILAAAGLDRLGLLWDRLESGEAGLLEPPGWLPAPGQGALAVQGREDAETMRRLLEPVDDPDARCEATAERAFLAALGGGCRVPIGAAAVRAGGEVILRGAVLSVDGTRAIEGETRANATEPEVAGRDLAETLLERGVGRLLDAIAG